jgi:thioredoxin-related protein
MKIVFFLMVCFPIVLYSQSDNGINWTHGLTWQEVKEKASRENKNLFIDVFTTWCGPCKKMDRDVFMNDTVAAYFNEHFVSVKVQMDKTNKDKEEIKRWYSTADSIAKRYLVDAYPTLIFLSPKGDLLHKVTGYRSVNDIVIEAEVASRPGDKIDDYFLGYQKFKNMHNAGVKDFVNYPFYIKIAFKVKDVEFGNLLIKELSEMVVKLKAAERYTRERIELWASFIISSNTRVFSFFLKDQEIIDKVMNTPGFSRNIVDNTIQNELVIPFLKQQAIKSGVAMEGGYLTDVSGKNMLRPDSSEAKWRKLYRVIRVEYNSSYAKRNVLKAKIEWYKRHRNYNLYVKNQFLLQKQFPPDYTNWQQAYDANSVCWYVFMNFTDKNLINAALNCMEQVIMSNRKNLKSEGNNLCLMFDTYANLLYKANRLDEAIKWQEEAIKSAKDGWILQREGFEVALMKMKSGEPTYGAKWGYE